MCGPGFNSRHLHHFFYTFLYTYNLLLIQLVYMKIVFLHILVYLIFVGLTSTIFLIFNFFTTRYKVSNKKMYVWNVIEGIVNGGVISIMAVVIYYWFNTINITLIFVTFAFIIIRNWKVFFASLILPLVTHWFIYNNFEYPYIYYILSVVIIMFVIWMWKSKTWTYI